MAEPEPTMAGHLKHGGWGMTPVNVTVLAAGMEGTVTIGVCDVCHLVIAQCNHEVNKWKKSEFHGEALICQLCGLDGT